MLNRSFTHSNPVPTEAGTFAFLFQCFKAGLFSRDAIVHLARFASNQPCLSGTACWLLSYFAPELEAADPQLTQEMIGSLHQSYQNPAFPQFLRSLSESLDRFSHDNWGKLKSHRDFFNQQSNDLLSILSHDDVSSLIQTSQIPSFSIDAIITPTPFLPPVRCIHFPHASKSPRFSAL
jgi:hypothetical protein